jgi:hypothetical protein
MRRQKKNRKETHEPFIWLFIIIKSVVKKFITLLWKLFFYFSSFKGGERKYFSRQRLTILRKIVYKNSVWNKNDGRNSHIGKNIF